MPLLRPSPLTSLPIHRLPLQLLKPQTFLTQPRPRAPPACQANPRLKLDNSISLAARATSSSAPSSTPAGRRTNRARSRVPALFLNLIASCGRTHHRHGQQQLLIRRQPVHQNRQTSPPLDCILLQLLKPFSPSLVPGRLRLVIRPVPAQLDNSISSAAPATSRSAPSSTPAGQQINRAGVGYLRCASISSPRAIVPIVDIVVYCVSCCTYTIVGGSVFVY